MSDLKYIKSKLSVLAPESESEYEADSVEVESELEVDPLASVNLFTKKKTPPKIKKEPVIEKVEPVIEKVEPVIEKVEPVIEKKKAKKKRVLSAAHKAALERGRLKGLETRRKKKEEKMRAKKANTITKRVEIAKKEQIKQINKPKTDDEFKKFYYMMNRYESIKRNQYIKFKKQQEQKRKNAPIKKVQIVPKKVVENNPYLKYFQ